MTSDNKKTFWWDKPLSDKNRLGYASYRVDDTEVIVAGRPDGAEPGEVFADSIDGWISVTDRLVTFPPNKAQLWAPWNEAGYPQVETIWAVLKTLDYWIRELKLKRIYINCDAGTHRSVSLFGFYLLAYKKNEAADIVKAHTLTNRNQLSDPLSYAESYLRDIPGLESFLAAIGKSVDNPEWGGESLENEILRKTDKEFTAPYYLSRNKSKFEIDLSSILIRLKQDLKKYSSYGLKRDLRDAFWYKPIQRPATKLKIWVHKKLGTKRGKFWDKHGF